MSASAGSGPGASEITSVRKALYSSAVLGMGSLDYIVAVFLLKYYTNYTGLDAKWAGLALLLGKASASPAHLASRPV